MKPIVQAPCTKASDNHKSKKKKMCITGLWDVHIPSELLQEILSHLGPKSNVKASVVCKAWCEAAVSVRKFPTLPWLFYRSEDGDYALLDPSKPQRYKNNLPELEAHDPVYSRDGWLLMAQDTPWTMEFFLNPFTRECIYLPHRSLFFSGKCLAFSAAPTSTSCLVVSFAQFDPKDPFVIATWRPGETVWTIHRSRHRSSSGIWDKCVFSNGVFYGFSICGYVAVFNPSRATLDFLPVKRWNWAAFYDPRLNDKSVLMMEHNGNIFVISRRHDNKSTVFKLNLERMVWEEKSEPCGLTVFASFPNSFRRSRRDRTYPSTNELLNQYYSLVDENISRPLTSTSLSNRVPWVDPPHNNVIL